MSPPRSSSLWALLASVLGAGAIAVALTVPGIPGFARFLLVLVAAGALLWAVVVLWRRLLWSVGRRLAFTYFLLGVLPIPLVLVLIFVAAYLLSGFFLGHLFRTAASTLEEELEVAARTRMAAVQLQLPVPASATDGFGFGYYRDGERIGGDPRAPQRWPVWLETSAAYRADRRAEERRADDLPGIVELEDGTLSIAAAIEGEGSGVVAFLDGDLEQHLRERSDVWIELYGDQDPELEPLTTVSLLGETFVLQPLERGAGTEARQAYLAANGGEDSVTVIGFELAGPARRLSDGEVVSSSVSATLTATSQVIFRHLFSSSSEVDTLGWVAFIVPAFLLFDIYALATLAAIFMILGLTRAVNRLSVATRAVQAGDFSVRIPVRRTDQLGDLQRSFNQMSESLERLVAEAALKEVLERELEIAHEVQRSLLPSELLQSDKIEFATYFEPSAAIGGDYYDIVDLEEEHARRLAVIIADVAGHGLSAGLRMAMLKAGLLTLVHEGKDPSTILPSLDRLVRSSHDHRSFVTATLAEIDVERRRVSLINAGHPPTYLLHDGSVEEILLGGTPLGVLGTEFGRRDLELEPGDALVWLSDGFIEAVGEAEEPFGYERAMAALAGPADSAAAIRERLLHAVRSHTGWGTAEDDRTLVVMRLRRAGEAAATAE